MGKRILEQIGSGSVDVVNKYRWSVSKKPIALNEVPTILITEYQQSASALRQAMSWFAQQGMDSIDKGTVSSDPYDKLYAVDLSEKGNSYIFPYYSAYHHLVENAWGENKGMTGDRIEAGQNFVNKAAKELYPSAGIESAKVWEGTTPAAYSFSFYLLNTVGTIDDIIKNKQLVYTLIHNNLMDKMNVIAMRPPALCSVEIPGMREKTIAVLRSIQIENVGQINRMKLNGNYYNIPDAYQVTIQVQELLTESRQIFSGTAKIVFADVKDIDTEISDGADKTNNTLDSMM